MTTGYVTVHLLDGFHGIPASGVRVGLFKSIRDAWSEVKTVRTEDSGRTAEPLLSPEEYGCGRYQLVVHAAEYFSRFDDVTVMSDPPYLTTIPLHLNFAAENEHYHVPMTLTPWGFTHFRGS